jgi:hypothetical protein
MWFQSVLVIWDSKTQAYVFISVYEFLFRLFATQFMCFSLCVFFGLGFLYYCKWVICFVVWMYSIVQSILLCVICGLMVIGIDIGVHNKYMIY